MDQNGGHVSSTGFGRFLDTAATIATWWFFKVGQFLIRLEMLRLDCSCAGLRTADETSAVGRTTAAPLVEQQHNSVYTTAQEIRQRKYIKNIYQKIYKKYNKKIYQK